MKHLILVIITGRMVRLSSRKTGIWTPYRLQLGPYRKSTKLPGHRNVLQTEDRRRTF